MDKDLLNRLIHPDYKGDELMCLHPRIIVNPALPELLAKYRKLVTPGKVLDFKNRSHSYFFLNFNYFSVNGNKITYDNYKDSFVLDEATGDTFPVYLLVPCNHCDLCIKSKRDAFAHRCVLETMCYDCLPWFLTLTYRDECLPKDGVSKRDVELFFKSFRIRLDRAGYGRYFRYTVYSEYSPEKHRPHYHMIIWNLKPKHKFQYLTLFRIAERAWDKGFVYNELVSSTYKGKNMMHPEKCFEYVSKYIGKESDVPDGCNPNFHHSSNRSGGIGAPFLDKFVIPTLRHTLNHNFLYLDIFSGNTAQVYFHRYILSRCFPTFSQSIPYKFRKAYILLQRFSAALDHRYRHVDVDRWLAQLHDFLPTYPLTRDDVHPPACLFSCACGVYTQQIDRCIDTLSLLLPKCDFRKARELDDKRHLFVSKMLRDRKPRDKMDVLYKYRLNRDKMMSNLQELPPMSYESFSVFLDHDPD